MPNRLDDATSPYLLQHATNPVDWYPWGEEAFAAARARDRPILLSVGYAACHWCHVMAHESFEDAETAALMNEHFVSVKVDREERPDVDRIYMDAVQAMTGHGGWPMTVFLTPEGRPFYAGTYFPPRDRGSLPSFRRVLLSVADAWEERRHEIEAQAAQLTRAVQRRLPVAATPPGGEAIDRAIAYLAEIFDERNGGFGAAPKFPQAPLLELLLRLSATNDDPQVAAMLTRTLRAMAAGGIHDQLGGGFARYTVDTSWRVPHFEKMLYDNALLARIYLRAAQVTKKDEFAAVARQTLDYLLTGLGLSGGGLASSEDADSGGVEGAYYVWTAAEFAAVTGGDAAVAAHHFGVTEDGNFEGANVLSRAADVATIADAIAAPEDEVVAAIDRATAALLKARKRRPAPARDDKVVVAWNGLALRALAEAGAVLGDARYLAAARANAEFVLAELVRDDGRLARSWRAGRLGPEGFCDDYAAYALGLQALYQADGAARWYRAARRLLDRMIELFSDPEGGFYSTAHDAESLITRPKDLMDNPTPSANALAAEALFIDAHLTGEQERFAAVERALAAAGPLLEAYPSAAGHMLATLHSTLHGGRELVIVGDGAKPLVDTYWADFRPETVLAWASGDPPLELPVFAGRLPHQGPALAYVCRRFACEAPTADPMELAAQLGA